MTRLTTWTRGDAERAAKALFSNQALHRAAAAMAGCHPHALDYIRQAPIIVLAANAGRTGPAASASAQRYAGPPMRMLAERGAKLRDVMAYYGCAYQLRHVVPSVLHPVRWDVLRQLGHIPPSTLAQIIPAARSQQDVWLRALTRWREHCVRRAENPWFRFDWAAAALRTVVRGQESTVDTIADLLVEAERPSPRGGAVFDLRWTLAQALAATDRWHRALARAQAERKAADGLGVSFTSCADYVPFPNEPVDINDFTFIPLRSCEDLWVEGAQMHHCVGTYSADVMSGRSRIFSIQQAGQRIATVEFGGSMSSDAGTTLPGVTQVRGPCNARPPKAAIDAATALLARVRADLAKAGPLRMAFPGIAGRFSDEGGPPAYPLAARGRPALPSPGT